MRRAFIQTLEDLAARDRRIVLMTGDLGFTVVESFASRFPDRFFNVGVAEQNLLGMATGLAEAGYLPFAYTMATFASLRAAEFLRNGPVAQRLPVRVVAMGGGVEYGPAGFTHHAVEDLALMRSQHGLSTIVPADDSQARAALMATWDVAEPVYYRIGKDEVGDLPGLNGRFRPGRVELVREGCDVLFLALGPMARACLDAAGLLSARGTAAAVAVVSNFNAPIEDELALLLARFERTVTVEAHSVTGGLGSLAAEIIAAHGLSCRLERRGIDSAQCGTGSRSYLEEVNSLSAGALAESVISIRPRAGGRSHSY
jgi:transketolase